MIALLSWFGLYLEILRYHHLVLSDIGSVVWPTDGAGARPGAFLRTVVVCSILAPMLFIMLWAWTRIRTGAVPRRSAWAPAFLMSSGLALILLAAINQIVRHPPIVVDLTLRTGNGGFVILGVTLAMIGSIMRFSKRA